MHRLVIALTTLLGLTAAGYIAGYLLLFGGSTDRAAGLVPANAAVYVNVYLQPSAGQQMNLAGLIGRLPGFADDASLDEKIDQVVQNVLSGTGIDYLSELKPWLGNQVAAASWFTDDEPALQRAVAIVEVKDQAAMKSSLEELAERQGESFSDETYQGVVMRVGTMSAYAVVAEMLVLSDSADGIRAVIDTHAGGANLAARADFRESMNRLPQDHLAAFFVDLAALADGAGMGAGPGGFTTASAALVAERDGLRLSGSAPLPARAEAGDASPDLGAETSTLADWMPADTIAEVTIFGLRGILADAEAAASGTPEGEQLTDALTTLRAVAAFGLGIDLDADVLPLLDREAALALTGIEGDMPRGQLLLRPDDADAAAAMLDRIAERLVASGGSRRVEDSDGVEITIVGVPQVGDVAYASVDGVLILALSAEDVRAAVQAHEAGSSLGAGEAYQRTFELAGGRAGNEAYVDVGGLLQLFGVTEALPDDARAILDRIGSFGVTAPSRDDQIEFHAVLTIDEVGAE